MSAPARLLLLLTALATALALTPAPAPAAPAGNRELMETWAGLKQQVKEKVFRQLQNQNALPRDGVVTFTATVKQNPDAPGDMLIRVERIDLSPLPLPPSSNGTERISGAEAETALEQAFKPVDLHGITELRELDIPVDTTVTDAMAVKDGRLLPEEEARKFTPPAPPAAPTPITGEPKAKEPDNEDGPQSWWRKFVEYLGL